MKKIIKLSIGIPAYNEAANIKSLLRTILSQSENSFKLQEIILVSDGSSDKTVFEANKVKSNKINIIAESYRKGKSERINQIINTFNGDILLLIDADIKIKDKLLFSKIVENNNFNKAGLISVNAIPDKANNFFQKIIKSGVIVSQQISSTWNNGNNYLSFKGCFLGLSRNFAKKIQLDNSLVNNDAYLYLIAKKLGYYPEIYKGAEVYYKSPKNLSDHMNQSLRFKDSKKEMKKYFKKNLSSEYDIPVSVYGKAFIKGMMSNPILFTNYLLVRFITFIWPFENLKSTWRIALSTK
ncbi:MAG TPA: glycosyltransferase family 2 protein [Candidatus Limnocylindrales bacterium]|nr:glycosyltransferase family 2 protein [Candidatus Limnocylindrales bacterium]